MSESLISEDRSLEIGRTPLPEGLKKIAKDGVPLASWAIILNGHKDASCCPFTAPSLIPGNH